MSIMSLSEKSDEELGSLLSQYGIKHGPIVDSTRHLYERKLEKAMEQASVKTSSDKTYYREEGRKHCTGIITRHLCYGLHYHGSKTERADCCCLPRCQSV
uniref:LEM domain-containing protein n=1 Tax=Neolamprologus brichardi TaxID=32507 RepID=A0A3Q4GEW8_NEOBR